MNVADLRLVLAQLPDQAEVMLSIDAHFADDICVQHCREDGAEIVFLTAVSNELAEPQWRLLEPETECMD